MFWVNWKLNAYYCDGKVDRRAASWFELCVGMEPRREEHPTFSFSLVFFSLASHTWKGKKEYFTE